MTKRDFQAREYGKEAVDKLRNILDSNDGNGIIELATEFETAKYPWPEPPVDIFEDSSISARYLEQIALAMRSQNINGATYVEDIADQLDSLGADYVRVVKSRDEAKTQANRFREDAAASARLMYTANSDCIDAQDECDKLRARVAELEKQLNTLLESQLWGVNCKPSGTDWLTKEDREKLLRLSYSLDYVQYATSADFIRSLLARWTTKVKEAE